MSRALPFALAVGLLTGCAVQDAGFGKAVTAQDPRLSDGALLAAVCSGCHADGGDIAVDLAGYDAARVEALLNVYKHAPEGPTAMHRMARGYTPAQILSIAAHLARDFERER